MEYSEDILKKVVAMGTLGYPLSKILNVLDIDDKDQAAFCLDFDNKQHPLHKAYQKGIDKADYAIDSRLFDLAKSGDIMAIKEFTDRKASYASEEETQRELRRIKK